MKSNAIAEPIGQLIRQELLKSLKITPYCATTIQVKHNRYLDRIVTYFGPTFLKPNEYEEIVKIKDKSEEEQKAWIQEKVAQRIKPFVYFVASLCRYLQEEEID